MASWRSVGDEDHECQTPTLASATAPALATTLYNTLPDELIDYICRFARDLPCLPPYDTRSTWFWEPSSRYLLEMRFPPPVTFLALRLVCKRLNRIATPYMWETLDVQLRHQPKNENTTRYLRSGKACGLEPGQELIRSEPGLERPRNRNSIDTLEYLVSNPHLTAMVRVLCLRVSAYTFAAMAREEAEGELERCIERLLTATKALTAFCIDKADLLTPLAASTLLSCKSLRLMDLRTVGFRGDGLEMFSGQEMPGLEYYGLSVFNLAYKSLKLPRNLRKFSLHCDSMSTFAREEAPVLEERLSVGTIEDLAIYDKHGDVALFVSKHFQNASVLGHQISLKELFLDLEWCHAPRLNKILSNFRGTSVKKLTIRNLHRMAPRGLSELAGYFPNVRELVLSSSTTDIVPAWIVGCFHEYIEALKGLRYLETLEWDNSSLCYFAKEVEDSAGACDASIAVLVKLPNLKSVRKISASSRTVSEWMIQRDDLKNERGGCNYKGYEVNRTEVFPDFEESQRLIAGLYK